MRDLMIYMKNKNSFSDAELSYIDELQSKADTLVSDPDSSFYEPQVEKRRTAARQLMAHWEDERAEKHRIEAMQVDK